VIGRARLPLIHEGEALYHVARFDEVAEVAENVGDFQSRLDDPGSTSTETPIV